MLGCCMQWDDAMTDCPTQSTNLFILFWVIAMNLLDKLLAKVQKTLTDLLWNARRSLVNRATQEHSE